MRREPAANVVSNPGSGNVPLQVTRAPRAIDGYTAAEDPGIDGGVEPRK